MLRILFSVLSAMLVTAGSVNLVAAQDKEEPEGGIIGTGIVGTITELGSIYVNGQHILFDDTQTVTSPPGDRPAASLVPGETVVVEALPAGAAWRAETIRAYLPLVGPVETVTDRSIAVLGVDIVIPDDAASLAAFIGTDLAPGDWIAVSGFWKGDSVIASRAERIAPLPMASVVGSYQRDGSIERVGSVTMDGVSLQHARPFDVLTVQGQPTADGIDAEAVAIGLFTGPVGEVLFEGYLSQPDLQGAYTVEGSGFLAYVGDPSMVIDPNRGLFCGSVQGVTPIARVVDLPEAAAGRDEVLRNVRSDPCVNPDRP